MHVWSLSQLSILDHSNKYKVDLRTKQEAIIFISGKSLGCLRAAHENIWLQIPRDARQILWTETPQQFAAKHSSSHALHRHESHQDEHDHESTGSVVLAKRPLNGIVFVTALVGFLKERCLLRAQECFAGTASFAVCHIILDPSLLSLKEKNREQ